VVFAKLSSTVIQSFIKAAKQLLCIKETLVLPEARTAWYLTRQDWSCITRNAICLNDEDRSTICYTNRGKAVQTTDLSLTTDLSIHLNWINYLGHLSGINLAWLVRLVDCCHLNSLARVLLIVLQRHLVDLTVISWLN
jgi:hypothetical protein